jgi:hypothetical protein
MSDNFCWTFFFQFWYLLIQIESYMIFSALVIITLIRVQNLSQTHSDFRKNGAFLFYFTFILYPYWVFIKRDKLLSLVIKFKYKNIKFKIMWSRTCLTCKLNDKAIKTPSKSHETIPLRSSELWSILIFFIAGLIL